ncbi:C-3 sterol dehydrogenase/C-4 decarboxylase family protein [Periconia macrospinosa]|uniref:C-3 sterol dehydrogenase/C-4 decarboxylase family protein n=1 Tax=Periconia macrospinosa TaxID=97972 RepID=A0A2V1DAD7_9PLEO|nr:C-3 sterol dehydrogenase/C-4 decarboxylase family protein [Periconia macrospinosa]
MASSANELLGSVLVTGGCGFQGHHLVQHILQVEPSCKIYAFDIDTSQPSRRHSGATYLSGDIRDAAAVDAAFEKMQPPPQVIFHTACPPSMNPDRDLHWAVNVDGTRHILAAADRVRSVRAFVLTSTVSVAYDGVAELRDVKELPILDSSKQSRGYSRSKGVCEREVLDANRKTPNGMLTCAIRQCTTFGPNDPGFFGNIVDVVKNQQAKYRFGNGQNLFDFIYVGNACHAHILAARKLLAAYGTAPLPVSERVEGEVFNVSNDEHIPFWDLTIKASNLLGYPLSHEEIVSIPKFLGLAMAYLTQWIVWLISFGKRTPKLTVAGIQYTFLTHTMNIDKAKERLQYTPQWSLDEGLRLTVDWYKDKDKQQ